MVVEFGWLLCVLDLVFVLLVWVYVVCLLYVRSLLALFGVVALMRYCFVSLRFVVCCRCGFVLFCYLSAHVLFCL